MASSVNSSFVVETDHRTLLRICTWRRSPKMSTHVRHLVNQTPSHREESGVIASERVTCRILSWLPRFGLPFVVMPVFHRDIDNRTPNYDNAPKYILTLKVSQLASSTSSCILSCFQSPRICEPRQLACILHNGCHNDPCHSSRPSALPCRLPLHRLSCVLFSSFQNPQRSLERFILTPVDPVSSPNTERHTYRPSSTRQAGPSHSLSAQ